MTNSRQKPRTSNSNDWISRSEAARLRGVSRQAVWELVRRGRLTTSVIAGKIRVSRAEVLGFKRRPRGPASDYVSREYYLSKGQSKGKKGKRRKTYDPSKWLPAVEAARALGVTRQVVADLIRRRRLRTLERGNQILVFRASLEAFKRQQSGPKAKH
jgi:excisionase family DNA binding protein